MGIIFYIAIVAAEKQKSKKAKKQKSKETKKALPTNNEVNPKV